MKNLFECDIDIIDIKSPSQYQIKQQEMKDSGWPFDIINSMTIYFNKITEMNGSISIKLRLRSSVILNTENVDEYCFIWSILAFFILLQIQELVK